MCIRDSCVRTVSFPLHVTITRGYTPVMETNDRTSSAVLMFTFEQWFTFFLNMWLFFVCLIQPGSFILYKATIIVVRRTVLVAGSELTVALCSSPTLVKRCNNRKWQRSMHCYLAQSARLAKVLTVREFFYT